jgi:hypothetical protein
VEHRGQRRETRFRLAAGLALYQASFTPNGAFVLTANEDGLARLWDVRPASRQRRSRTIAGCATPPSAWKLLLAAKPAATGVGCRRAPPVATTQVSLEQAVIYGGSHPMA